MTRCGCSPCLSPEHEDWLPEMEGLALVLNGSDPKEPTFSVREGAMEEVDAS